MFHQGDLNSGISASIAEGKLVACFITEPANDEARVWEEEWLGQKPRTVSQGDWRPSTGDIFATKAVILRIALGSQEASFLNAFCPVTHAPTFLIIHNGQVLEKLEAGVKKRDFIERVSKALGLEVSVMTRQEFHEMREAQGNQGPEEVTDATEMRSGGLADQVALGADARIPPSSQTTTPGIATPDSVDTAGDAASSSIAQEQPLSPSTQLRQEDRESNMSSLFPDRSQRMEAEKAKREAAEKAERTARQNARRKEAEEAHAAHVAKDKGKSDDSVQKEKARRDWLVQQKNRKDEAKKERARILAQIEADKQERKARSVRPTEAPSEPLPASADAASRRRTGAGGMCNLAIRLFDGSSIKGRFEPSATLGKTVRSWIGETTNERGNVNAADIPYTFKQIMAPLPSRSIEISEENQSLAEMGLVPNATLVLVPVSEYTEAYASNGSSGYIGSAFNAVYSVAGAASGLALSAFSYVPGFGGAATRSAEVEAMSSEQSAEESNAASTGSMKVKTIADQRAEFAARQDQQTEFYNGNSSAFQGRKDDEDDNGEGSR